MMDHLELNFRFDTLTEAGEFSGYAVVWNERNAHNEIVQRGAFLRSFKENSRPPMLWSHNPAEVIGVWTEIREDATGLFVKGKIVTSTTRGKEAYDLLKAQAIDGLSIGFRAVSDKRGPNGTRILTEINLAEISIVAMPSAGKARITSVRSSGRSVESAAAFVQACRKAKCALAQKRKPA